MAGISPGSRNLILIMLVVVVAGILIARSYYGKKNRVVDPRIRSARELYSTYDRVALEGDYYRIFGLLDSIEKIYRSCPFYHASFELGVLDNNRGAAMLTLALFGDSIPGSRNPYAGLNKDSILDLAEARINRAILLYQDWNSRFSGKTAEQIREMIGDTFTAGLRDYDPSQVEKSLQNRILETLEAVEENMRRLSVCHTNLGVIYRLRKDYEEAAREYKLALELWDRNLEAENNLNRLLNRPIKERNILQKMFPPEREQ